MNRQKKRSFENVKEGVKSVMGGRVLEYEAKTILRQGMGEGIKERKMVRARETAFALGTMELEKEYKSLIRIQYPRKEELL